MTEPKLVLMDTTSSDIITTIMAQARTENVSLAVVESKTVSSTNNSSKANFLVYAFWNND